MGTRHDDSNLIEPSTRLPTTHEPSPLFPLQARRDPGREPRAHSNPLPLFPRHPFAQTRACSPPDPLARGRMPAGAAASPSRSRPRATRATQPNPTQPHPTPIAQPPHRPSSSLTPRAPFPRVAAWSRSSWPSTRKWRTQRVRRATTCATGRRSPCWTSERQRDTGAAGAKKKNQGDRLRAWFLVYRSVFLQTRFLFPKKMVPVRPERGLRSARAR